MAFLHLPQHIRVQQTLDLVPTLEGLAISTDPALQLCRLAWGWGVQQGWLRRFLLPTPLTSVTPETTPRSRAGRRANGGGAARGGRPTHTKPWEVLPVVEAASCLAHTLEVHLAFVAHTVHVGGAIGPRHTGHAPACLYIPATDVHHSAWLPFSSWEDSGPTSRVNPRHKDEPQLVATASHNRPPTFPPHPPTSCEPPTFPPDPHSPSCEPHSQSGPRTTFAPWKMPLNGILGRPWRGLSMTL